MLEDKRPTWVQNKVRVGLHSVFFYPLDLPFPEKPNINAGVLIVQCERDHCTVVG